MSEEKDSKEQAGLVQPENKQQLPNDTVQPGTQQANSMQQSKMHTANNLQQSGAQPANNLQQLSYGSSYRLPQQPAQQLTQSVQSAQSPQLTQPAQPMRSVQPNNAAAQQSQAYSTYSGPTTNASSYTSQTRAHTPYNQNAQNQHQNQGQSQGQRPSAYTQPSYSAARSTPPQNAQTQTQMPTNAHLRAAMPQPSATYGAYNTANAAGKNSAGDKKPSKLMPALMGGFGVFVGALLSLGLMFLVFGVTLPGTNANVDTGSEPNNGTSLQSTSYNPSVTITPDSEDASLAEAVASKALPSVVNIDVYATSKGGFLGDSGSSSGGDDLQEYGLGSGIVISEDGYILTNYHVIEYGEEFLVRFDQDNQFSATVVGQDQESDLAVLKVDATGLTPIEIGDSNDVAVGEWVMALGSPFGLEKSVTTGIVSATLRSTTMESTTGRNIYANMIQTDAAINPGNSGGALVNAQGQLIGINTLINSSTNSSAGVGFAIPSNYAMAIAEQIISGKEVEHAYLGVSVSTVDAGNARELGSSVDAGAHVESVEPNSPAAEFGLQEGDVVTKFNGIRVYSADELMINVRGKFVGDKVTLELLRDGQTKTVEVTLGSDKL